VHLLASAFLIKIPLWKRDKKLQEVSSKLGLKYWCRTIGIDSWGWI